MSASDPDVAYKIAHSENARVVGQKLLIDDEPTVKHKRAIVNRLQQAELLLKADHSNLGAANLEGDGVWAALVHEDKSIAGNAHGRPTSILKICHLKFIVAALEIATR